MPKYKPSLGINTNELLGEINRQPIQLNKGKEKVEENISVLEKSETNSEVPTDTESKGTSDNTAHPYTQQKNFYTRPTHPDLQFDEIQNYRNFSGNSIYEWIIDDLAEYQSITLKKQMTMIANIYKEKNKTSEEDAAKNSVLGFNGILKNLWDSISEINKNKILKSYKKDVNRNMILDSTTQAHIPNAIEVLVYTILLSFIGDPQMYEQRNSLILQNHKCKSLHKFRWYKNTFLARVYQLEDVESYYWKERFIVGLPKSFFPPFY
ncbi:hypothetical protein CDL12_09443 [Handroanthus impetiginosus]|uniref:DUF7746 domain-containing protein n=1 Tax=Handroanthus impetiginosus TaxID=429701 RepID=A0A2G9HK31_9LAMI|nr:hypothetical protein CDL12_09443 [Handroanthus impetiginosus]